MLDMIICGIVAITFLGTILITVRIAYRTVVCKGESIELSKRKNGDVPLDDICKPCLKLTNLEDINPL